MTAPPGRRRGEAVLLALTATWGTTFIAIQDVLPHWPPFMLMAARFALATAVLLPAAIAPQRPRQTLRRVPWREGSLLGLWAFAGFGLQTVSLQYTSAAHTAFGTAMVTIIVPVLACTTLGHPWRASTGAGLCAATAGIALLLGDSGDASVRAGDLLALGAAVAFSWQVLLLERYGSRHPALPLVAGELTVTALLSGIAAALLREPWPPQRGAGWAIVIYLGLVATAVCMLGQVWGQARTSATRAAFIYALEPIFAAAFGWVVRGQTLSARECIGGGLIVTAAVIADRPLPARLRRPWR